MARGNGVLDAQEFMPRTTASTVAGGSANTSTAAMLPPSVVGALTGAEGARPPTSPVAPVPVPAAGRRDMHTAKVARTEGPSHARLHLGLREVLLTARWC